MSAAPPPFTFLPFTKKSEGNQSLNILDFSQLFVADAPMKKKKSKFSYMGGVLKFPRILDPFYKVSCYIKWGKTAWTYRKKISTVCPKSNDQFYIVR